MPIYTSYLSANQIDAGQLTGTSSLAVSASYSQASDYALSSGTSTTASYAQTASYAMNSSIINTGSFIVTSSIYKQNIIGDLGTSNLSSEGSASFNSVYLGSEINGVFRLRTSGSNINNMALTIEFYSASTWLECGYFKK